MLKTLRAIVLIVAAWVCCPATTAYPAAPAGGGDGWTAIGPDGANVIALAVDPRTPLTVFAGTMGLGVLKSPDGGASWTAANSGLSIVDINALAIDPVSTSTLFIGTAGGVFKSMDGAQSWAAANEGLVGASPLVVTSLAMDPGSPGSLGPDGVEMCAPH